MTTPTRGERNANPGNIDRVAATHWQGQSADQSGDPRFVVFDSPEWGIRAIAKELLTYQTKHACGTIREIINRWAPPVENNTKAYIAAVATDCGVAPDDQIAVTDPETMQRLVKAIIEHENGRVIYSDAQIADGVSRALA